MVCFKCSSKTGIHVHYLWPTKQMTRVANTVRLDSRVRQWLFLKRCVVSNISSFSQLLCDEMSSMCFNAPSSSTSMNCTYPPTNRSSKQRKHNGDPFKRNKWIGTPLFFLHSSLPSLRLGHCCRHCGRETLHLSVSCI